MNLRPRILKFSKLIAGQIRLADRSADREDLLDAARGNLLYLWDIGCCSETLSDADKTTCRRVVIALEKMIK